MSDRPPIPAELERQVKLEAGYLCAMPGCNMPSVHVHHIVPYATCQEHKSENLIALCPNHHTLVHEGKIDAKALKQLKAEMAQRRKREDVLEAKVGLLSESVMKLIERDEQLEREMAEIKSQLTVARQPQSRQELQAQLARLEKAGRLFNEGVAAYRRADYLKALRHWEASRTLVKTSTVLNNLGVIYDDLRRYEDALAAYEEAERLRRQQGLPPDPDLAKNRGVVYRQLGRLDDALAEYDEAERLRKEQGLPPDPAILFNRALVHLVKGDTSEACRLAREAKRLCEQQRLPVPPQVRRLPRRALPGAREARAQRPASGSRA